MRPECTGTHQSLPVLRTPHISCHCLVKVSLSGQILGISFSLSLSFLLPVPKLCNDMLHLPIPSLSSPTPGFLHTSRSHLHPPECRSRCFSPSPRINNTTPEAHGDGLPRHGQADTSFHQYHRGFQGFLPAAGMIFPPLLSLGG